METQILNQKDTNALDQPRFNQWDYDIFISYRRLDGTPFAQWLRRCLQTYRLPPKLAKGRPPLRIFVDTAYERVSEDFWGRNIEPALGRSRYLVVVVTPASLQAQDDGQPNWVEREIDFFVAQPQGHNIFVIITRGASKNLLPGGLHRKFPRISITDFNDFNPNALRFWERFKRRKRLLPFFATVYNIPNEEFAVLRQEEERRKRRIQWLISVSIGLILVAALSVIGAVGYSIRLAQEVTRERSRANEQRAIADGEKVISAKQLLLMQLNLSIARLNTEARLRARIDAGGRGVMLPPSELRLINERMAVSELLQRMNSESLKNDAKWHKLYNDLNDFVKVTEDLDAYSLRGFEKYKNIESEIQQLFADTALERDELYKRIYR